MDRIVTFSGLLRENGIPVSIRSTYSGKEVSKLFKEDDPLFKDAMAAVYVKEQKQRESFNQTFDEFFGGVTADSDDGEDDGTSVSSKKNVWSTKSTQKWTITHHEDDNSNFKAPEIKNNEFNYHPPLNDHEQSPIESELLNRDINTLNSFEPELFLLCHKMGKKIAMVRSRRQRQARIMRPDVRRTIRKNLQNGGALIDLVKSKPRIKKNHHFFLNDVSGSCDWISNWFFCLVYAAQNSFRRVRVFDFDHRVAETTSAMTETSMLDAFIKVRDIRQKNLMVHGTSNMFQAFESFLEKVQLNRRSTLMILTDCRDWAGPKVDGVPESARLVEEMSRKCRKVLIFNPEDRKKWDVVDSCVSHYRDAGAMIHEVRNLNQLALLVRDI
ncbi:VWA containing CoxE family protein [Methanobacterium subterraneum]|uniref:VWA containing CoxE family protein n=1 Tax=Methanobacterium subterraneum TaxID=59277 RepID=A0A2H4VNS2_9EURY|nr:VWA domain-containing protein [Methanobacterium subterraneum]AUB59738.1 VWA containing CoxE family protein [Methanobacterium subterraneum]